MIFQLVDVSALSCLPCFDTVGWVTDRTYSLKNCYSCLQRLCLWEIQLSGGKLTKERQYNKVLEIKPNE